MRVAFDGAPLGDGPVTGVARAFVDALAVYAADAERPPLLLLPAGAPDPGIPGVEVVPAPRGALRRQVALPRLLRRLAVDVLHSPVAAVPLFAPCPTIATVHDLPWLWPGAGERATVRQRLATRWSLRRAAAVLAPSAFTLDAARRLVPTHPRLRLVPHGTRPPAAPPPPVDSRRGPLLVLGDDRPRKNRALVRRAHDLANGRCADLPELRFAGPPDGWVEEAEKTRLLRECRALVQCSTFEGFGLPVLEGLAHGAPVVCSELPPFREIAADSALFVDPRSPAAIADALVRVHEDRELRERLAVAGPLRAARFDLRTVASRWRELHDELAAAGRARRTRDSDVTRSTRDPGGAR